MSTQQSPAQTLQEQGIPAAFLDREWLSPSPTSGRDVWRAVVRFLEPRAVVAIAHLAASGWAVTIDVDQHGRGLFISMFHDDPPANR